MQPAEAFSWTNLYPPSLENPIRSEGQTGLSLFEATRARQPEAPCIHYLDSTLSWKEIDAQSRKVAAWLLSHGVAPGDRVSLWTQNIPEFVGATLGTWRTGCSVVPLNPMLRERELLHQLNDSGAVALFAEGELLAAIDAGEVVGHSQLKAMCVVGDAVEESAGLAGVTVSPYEEVMSTGASTASLDHLAPSPEDAALLVYTSGTTGLPKAAVISHANVSHNAHVFRTWAELGAGDVILGGAPLFHITGMMAGICASFASGCPLVLFYRFRAEQCLRMVEKWRATFTVLPSTALRALLDLEELGGREVSTLTKCYSGGAPIPAALADEWRQRVGNPIYSVYGLTETTSPSHAAPLGRPVMVDARNGMLSVGIPVQDTCCKVVDENGLEVPYGQMGELWIKGPGVISSYWRNSEATRSAISAGYLKTGDVGYRDDLGWFYVVDRIKDMINASGFKVWPREIEEFLLAHPAVAEAAVVGVPDDYRGETVKAFVRLRDGHLLAEEELIEWCRGQMAAYKYPRQVEFVAELPKTASGKVLRRELRAQVSSTAMPGAEQRDGDRA
ncbi:MAG: AMP-binding protein [Actinomycetota bacterium]|nr:AMP-binding protein [Actinomycetota bacterium]